MSFYTESAPPRGEATTVAPGVLRVVADNPSKMTYHGTNTYIIETGEGIFVLDPGPADDQAHLSFLIALLDGRAAGIIVSHHHSDHLGLVPQLRSALNVPVYAYAAFADDTFIPEMPLSEGDEVAGMTALHTPGHASDHLCFARDDGVLFTGDHVMSWNSSIVAPPDGSMTDYCAQLRRLLERRDKLYLPGHGPSLYDPWPYTRRLLDHRERREREILDALAQKPASVQCLAAQLYRKTDLHLQWAAQRNVEAHLAKLRQENIVEQNAALEWTLLDRL